MVENNDIGQTVADAIWYEKEYENIVNDDKKGIGVRSTKSTKPKANILLKEYLEKGWLKIHDERTVYELSKYEEIKPNVYAAGKHENDDCVTALLWAIFFLITDAYDNKLDGNKDIGDEFNVMKNDWDETEKSDEEEEEEDDNSFTPTIIYDS